MSKPKGTENGIFWLGKPKKFLSELPKKIVFPMIGFFEGETEKYDQIIELKSDTDDGTLWGVKYIHSNSVIMHEVIYRRKTTFIPVNFRDCNSSDSIWLIEPGRGAVFSPDFTGLRSFQNIGIDTNEKI